MIFRILSTIALAVMFLAAPANAQSREVPFWASIKTEELNMRVGPSLEYKIDWVFKRRNLPVKVVRIAEGWWLIRDSDGAQGWASANLLSVRRSALVVGDGLAAIRDAPAQNAKLKWNVETGVVGALGDCKTGWCAIDIRGHAGWIKQSRLWGTGEP